MTNITELKYQPTEQDMQESANAFALMDVQRLAEDIIRYPSNYVNIERQLNEVQALLTSAWCGVYRITELNKKSQPAGVATSS